MANNIPLIFGHRGASGYKVDNTFSAFDLAIEQGADGLESDIFQTTDGIQFMFHNSTCKLKGQDEEVKTNTLHSSDLAKIVLPDNETVPTFAEFLERYSTKNTKAGKPLLISLDFQYVARKGIASLVKEYNCEDRMYLCTGNSPMFRGVRKISKKIHLVASNCIRSLTFSTYEQSWSKYRRFGIEIFNIKAADFLPEYPEKLKQAGYDFFIWDLHDEERLRKYLLYRPTAIYSNYPDLAVKIRDELFGN